MSLPFCTPAAFVTPTGLSGYRFEVIDMDRNRVDKLLITQVEASQGMVTRSSGSSSNSEPSGFRR